MAHVIAAVIAAQIRHANDKAKLAEGQALTAALIEGSPDAIVVTGPDGRIVRFNPAAEALFDRRRADVLGQELAWPAAPRAPPGRVRRRASGATWNPATAACTRARCGIRRCARTAPSGSVELTPVPITVDGVVHFCGFMRDISELEHRARRAGRQRDAVPRARPAGPGRHRADGRGRAVYVRQRPLVRADRDDGGRRRRDRLGRRRCIPRTRCGWNGSGRWPRPAAPSCSTDCRLVSASGREIWVHAAAVPLLTAEGRGRLPGRGHRRLGPQAGGGRARAAAGRGAGRPAQPG